MAIQFYLTNAGKAAVLDAENMGLSIALSHIGVGTAKYNPQTAASNTALVAELEQYPLNGGSVEPVSRTLRFISNIEPTVTADCFEIGLFTSAGILFAVASTTGNTPLMRLVADIVCIATFGMKVEDINVENLVLQLDPHAPVSVALMNQHLAHSNPHPQYPLSTELANVIWHVGSWHGTDSTQYDPSIALRPLFGYDTSWMLLPHIPYGVEDVNQPVGAITGISTGSAIKAFTTRIWKRLRDGTSAPAYSLTADKAVVDEGGKVTFKLVTSGLDAGTPVDWSITGIQKDDISPSALSGQFIVDASGKASYTVDVVEDNKTEGNEFLKFALTYIPNKQANVLIVDTSKYPEGGDGSTGFITLTDTTKEITIPIQANYEMEIEFAAAGGGGGAMSAYPRTAAMYGQKGGDTTLTIGSLIFIAGGGGGGSNIAGLGGDDPYDRYPGLGGVNTIPELSGLPAGISVEIIENFAGEKPPVDYFGNPATTNTPQRGGYGWAIGSVTKAGEGGESNHGVGSLYWTSAGGGSGGKIKLRIKNENPSIFNLKVKIGAGGYGGISVNPSGYPGLGGVLAYLQSASPDVAPPVPVLIMNNIAPITDPAPEDKVTVSGTILTNGIAMPYEVKVNVGATEISAVIGTEQNSDNSYNWSAVINVGGLTQNTLVKAQGNAKHLIYPDLISEFSNTVQKTLAVTITPEPEPDPETGTE